MFPPPKSWKDMTIITYTGSFKHIAAIFLDKEQKQILPDGNHQLSNTTPNFDSLPQAKVGWDFFFLLKWPERIIPQLAATIDGRILKAF